MKRLWILLVAVLLVAQSAYAAAGAYCTHEAERNAPAQAHWGHHFHAHLAADAPADPEPAAPDFHGDCGFCHAAAAVGLVAHAPAPAADSAAAAPIATPPPAPPEGRADLPDRPQWAVPALA